MFKKEDTKLKSNFVFNLTMSQCRQCQRPLKNCICRGKPSDGAGFGSFLTGAIVGAAVVGVGALFAMAASEENSKQTRLLNF